MENLDKALRIHTALVKAGVDPEYAREQLQQRAGDLEAADVALVTADILGGTPLKYVTLRAETAGEGAEGRADPAQRTPEDFRNATLTTVNYTL